MIGTSTLRGVANACSKMVQRPKVKRMLRMENDWSKWSTLETVLNQFSAPSPPVQVTVPRLPMINGSNGAMAKMVRSWLLSGIGSGKSVQLIDYLLLCKDAF